MHDVETMMSARGVTPWHFGETGTTGQTTVVSHAPNAAEAIELAQLDWQVECLPVYSKNSEGNFREVPNRFAVTRNTDERVFGVISDKWVPMQNADAFQFLDNLVDDGLEYETAGALRNGATVFVTAKIPRDIMIGGEDAHELYLFISNDHRGLHAVQVGVTPVRIVCRNTMNLALQSTKRMWSAPHLSTLTGRLADARKALDLTFKYVDQWEEMAEGLAAAKMTDKDFDDFLEVCLATDMSMKTRETVEANVKSLWNSSPTIGQFKGTRWGALNAVGEYYDWLRPSRTPEARLIGSIEANGAAVKMRDRALSLLSS